MKFSEFKEKWSLAKEKINGSIILDILLIVSFILGFILTMISIPLRIMVYIGAYVAGIIGILMILGASLGFFFTPHITIYRYLWILFVSGCIMSLPTFILALIDYLVKLSVTWPLIFKK